MKHEDYEKLKEEHAALKKHCALLEQMMDNIHEGLYVTDENHRIIYFNRFEAENEGFLPEHVGKTINEIYDDDNISNVVPNHVMETGKSILDQQNSYYTIKGDLVHVFFSCYPFIYNNQIEGNYVISRHVLSEDPYISAILTYEKQLTQQINEKSGSSHYYLNNIIGSSSAISESLEQARKVSQHTMPVMIVGETGTGKEMFAQGIHNAGKTIRGDFVAINCAAVPETLLEGILFGVTKGAYTGAVATPGLFEQAEDGTIFLDEVNSMPISLQMKLLRVLQEKRVRPLGGKKEIPINCRIISSTNVDPFDTNGQHSRQIRADLLYRLASATVYVPPLRERKEDIPELCQHFIKEQCKNNHYNIKEISPLVLEKLYQYDWPGNVRELQNIIVGSLLNVDKDKRILETKHLPATFRNIVNGKQIPSDFSFHPTNLKDAVADYERKIIVEAILRSNGNISKAAKSLGVTRPNLYNKIEKLEIHELLPHAPK